jgi:hypothetical protein
MKHGNRKRLFGIVLLCTPVTGLLATIATVFWHGQTAKADTVTRSAAASIYQGTTTSFLGMALITIGCGVFLFSAFKHINRTKRTKKSRGVPVLFDRLDSDGIARLQKKISQVSTLPRVAGRSYQKGVPVPDIFNEICEPVDEFDNSCDHADDQTAEWRQVVGEANTDPRENW